MIPPEQRGAAAAKPARRRRGVILSEVGLRRCQAAQRDLEGGKGESRLSLERMSFDIGLSTKTISRVLHRELPVDLRTLDLLFTSLGIALERGDYIPAATPLEPARALPERRTTFFGRSEALVRLGELFTEKRSITLTGPGGVGKTRLASEAVTLHAAGLFDRVAYCDLSVVPDPSFVAAAVVAAFGGGQEQRSPSLTLGAMIGSERTLLLLDNCEHVVTRVAHLIGELLDANRNLLVFATSRQALGIEGEAVVRVAPLELPARAGTGVSEALQNPAVALFVDRARLVDDAFRLTAATLPAVIDIVARVEGIPLALELTASRSATAALGELAESLRDHLRALTSESEAYGPRHRSARALIDWSFELLDDEEKRVFRRLAIFMGSFDASAVADVCALRDEPPIDAVNILGRLAHKSLLSIERDGGATRFRMLETVRQYAASKVLERQENDPLRLRHAYYYHDLLLGLGGCTALSDSRRSSVSDVWRADRPKAQDRAAAPQRQRLWRIALELDNVREALEWSTNQSGNLHIAAGICCNLYSFWDTHGDFVEGEMWLRRALRCEGSLCTEHTRAQLHEALALMLIRQSRPEAAMVEAREAERLFTSIEEVESRLRARNLFGIAALEAGAISTARPLLELNLSEAQALRNAAEVTVALNNLGRLHADYDGDVEGALDYFERALIRARDQGIDSLVVVGLSNIVEACATLRRYGEALENARRGMAEAAAIGNQAMYARLALRSALCRVRAEGYAAAESDIVAARDALAKQSQRLYLSSEIAALADALLEGGRPQGAALLLGALEYLRKDVRLPNSHAERYQREVETRVRAALGDSAFETIRVRGASYSVDEALEEATLDEPLDDDSR